MIHKRLSRMIAFMFIIVLLTPLICAETAEKYALFEFDMEDPLTLYRASVIEDDFYHSADLFVNNFDISEYTLLLIDDEGRVLVDELVAEKITFNILYLKDLRKIKIIKDDITFVERPLLFCNYNNVCEPCRTENCTVAENTLTCTDCDSGSADDYCDLIDDGICDPDCNNEDSDCDGCEPYCFTSGMEEPEFCSDFQGEICDEGETCVGDLLIVETVDADGGSRCCVGDASCVLEEVPNEVPDYVFSDEYGSDVLSEDDIFEMEVQAREKYDVGFDEESLTEEELDELHEEYYGMDVTDPLIMTDEDWEELWDDPSFPAESDQPPTFTENVVEKLEEAKAAVPEEATPLLIIFLAVLILITLGFVVILLSHQVNKHMSREVSASRIEREIINLLKRGYSYDQIRTLLLNKGYDLITVNQAIMDSSRAISMQNGKR